MVPDPTDPFEGLPALEQFGRDLADAGRRQRMRRRWSRHSATVVLVGLCGVTGTAMATAAALRATVVTAPDPRIVPARQTPTAGSSTVAEPRAEDPVGGPPWALRVAKTASGLTCTTVGQIRGGVFGIVGEDHAFRVIPATVTDACGAGVLLGSRIVADPNPARVRSIVYGVAGPRVRRVVLQTTTMRRALPLGAGGTFVASLRGYPEDTAPRVAITDASGHTRTRSVGANPRLVVNAGGGPAWRLSRYVLGTRQYCAQLTTVRGPDHDSPEHNTIHGGRATLPTTCVDRRAAAAWAVSALRVRSHEHGLPGFDSWDYGTQPARTVVLGVSRRSHTITQVQVTGPGVATALRPIANGTFALFLPARVDPATLRFTVHLASGRIERGTAGAGTVPDLVPSRRLK